jgi:hypothetical protein
MTQNAPVAILKAAGYEPKVLRPFNRAEVLSIDEAARIAGKSPRTLREWCLLKDIGRRIGGRWAVSRIALAMLLDDDQDALKAYIAGDRSSPAVTTYFERCGVPLPRWHSGGGATAALSLREQQLSELNEASRP